MKYTHEVIAAARVVLEILPPTFAGTPTIIPQDLVDAAQGAPGGATPADLMALWNNMKDSRLPECKVLTSGRRAAAVARLRQFPDRETWEGFMRAINTNAWTLGETRSPGHEGWKANFDWFVRPGSVVKYLEGGFKPARASTASPRDEYREKLDNRG